MFSFGKMWIFVEKRPYFRADMAGLGKYHMGGYGRIGVYRVNNKQGGFRKRKSTISTVAALTDDILIGLNNKQYTIATFIDFKKAFDTINHKILIKKLPQFGLKLNTIDWITHYLTKGTPKCTINGLTSNERPIL